MKRFGLKDVRQLNTDSQASIVYRSFLEEQMGYSGEQTDAFIVAIDGLRGDFDLLKREGSAKTNEEAVAQIRKYGAYINKQGELISAQVNNSGTIVKNSEKNLGKANFDAFMRLNEGVLEKATQEKDRNIQLSEQIANNTVDIAKRIEMGVTYFLQGIYNTLDAILNFFVGGNLEETGKRNAQTMYKNYDKNIEKIENLLEANSAERQKIRGNSTLSSEQKTKALEGLEAEGKILTEGLAKTKSGK